MPCVVRWRSYVLLVLGDKALRLPEAPPDNTILADATGDVKVYEYTSAISNIEPRVVDAESAGEWYWCASDDVFRVKAVYGIPIADDVGEVVERRGLRRSDTLSQYMVGFALSTDVMYPLALRRDMPGYVGSMYYMFDYEDAKQAQLEMYKRYAFAEPGIVRVSVELKGRSLETLPSVERDDLAESGGEHAAYRALAWKDALAIRDEAADTTVVAMTNMRNVLIMDASLECALGAVTRSS